MSMAESTSDLETPDGARRKAAWRRDRALVLAAVDGDAAARDEVARRMDCIPIFLADYNRRVGRPLSDAEVEEQARNVVLAVWRRLDSFQGKALLETWMYRFCEFTISNVVRKKAPVPVSLDTTREPAAESDGAETLASQDAAAVRDALNRLEEREAAVVRLRYFEGEGFAEIARRLNVSIHAVKRLHVIALERLGTILGSAFRADEP